MKKTMITAVIGILLLSVFTVFLSIDICDASGNILYVGGSGPGNYSSIQSAIDAPSTSDGDTIYVYSGNYTENVKINKVLTLTGENKESTIINGVSSVPSENVVKITVNNVNISGFTIQKAVGIEMKCIMMDKVQNCKITNNIIKSSNDGIYLFDSDGNILSENTIKDNDVNGIFASYSDNNVFENNQIYYNQNGINIGDYSDNNEIFNNDILGKQGSYPQGMGVNMGTSTSGNLVYRNYFNDFDKNAYDSSTGNTWYKSSTEKGNYWDDYMGKDLNGDGIGDTPYNIPGGDNQDIYPLVNKKPVAIIDSISPNPATQGQAVYFSGHGIDSDGTIVDWEWKSSINDVLSHSSIFNSAGLSVGTHTISFKVKDDDGTWSEPAEETLVINPSGQQNQKPTAQIVTISPNPATYGDPVYFHGLGIDNNGGIIVAYNWCSNISGFLNGNSTFTKSNLSVGIHTIYFKVRNNMGEWSDEISTSLVIQPDSSPSNEPPTADAGGPYSGYVNVSISFDGSKSTDDGTITSYEWNFGDGHTGTGVSPTHTYTETRNYTVTLTVTDDGGKTDTDTTYTNVSIQPTNGNGEKKTPDFEIITVIISITLILLWRRRNL